MTALPYGESLCILFIGHSGKLSPEAYSGYLLLRKSKAMGRTNWHSLYFVGV